MTSQPVDDRDKPSPDWVRPPEPAMHRAARHGDLSELQSLVESVADVNVKANLEFDNGPHLNGLTTLMVAARSIDGASTETLRWLIEHGADIHARSEGGNTAAWYAAGHGARWEFHGKAVTPDHVERLRYLLDLGLDPGECNFVGRSLITEACEAGDPARVRLLLDRGASATTVQVRSQRLTRATMQSLGLMLDDDGHGDSADVPRGDADSSQIPLFCASTSGSVESVNLILKAGADPNTRDSFGSTALMVSGSPKVVRMLLNAGADLHATDEYGQDAFEAILEASCDSGACGPERFEVARTLVEAGVDIERVDHNGMARLASAAFGHHADSVEFLLKLGAKVNVLDADGGTALHWVCWQDEDEDEDTNRACEQIIRTLVRSSANVTAVDSRGMSAMHQAAHGEGGNQTAIRTLLELGADADPSDNDGDTPLMLAAANGETECVRLLLRAGASPARTNKEGRSALDAATAHLRSCETVVEKGPDVSTAEELKQMNEGLARELGAPSGYEWPDLSELLDDQAQEHQSALDEARKCLEAITQTLKSKGGKARP